MNFAQWLRARKDEIGAGTAILGLIIGLGGFSFTIWQLSRTTATLQAANTYQVQKDAREVLENILTNPKFAETIRGNVAPQDKSMVEQNLWIMFNFYLSVFRQSESNGLSPEFVSSFKSDFCNFLQYPTVSEGWKQLSTEKRLGAGHDQMRKEWCGA